MSRKKAIVFCILLILGMLAMLVYFTFIGNDGNYATNDNVPTIHIWYTDEALTDYINSAAVSYLDEYGVRVVPELKSGLEYLEEIYGASISGNDIPDLYIVGTDSIEKSAMAGLAIPIMDSRNVVNGMYYPEVALDSVTYHNEIFGYPFYYETSFLLYNASYLREIADAALRQEIAGDVSDESDDESAGTEVSVSGNDAPPEGYSEEEWNSMVAEKMESLIPSSIDDILQFANDYAAPANVENIFLWDVSDIFYNYFFAGAYMDIGGRYGDDRNVVEIYNENTVECLTVYQSLHQFFSIDSRESDYQAVLDTFLDGKTIFMIATTDAVASIVQAQYEGRFVWDYSVAPLPGVDSEHEARGLSATNAIIVNGYTEHRSEADDFARYLTNDSIETFFQRTGKLAAANGVDDYIVDATDLARDMYKVSVPLPEFIELSDFWVELELAYTLIWNGADVDETLSELQDTIENQLNGQ